MKEKKIKEKKTKEIKNGYSFRTVYSAIAVGIAAGLVVSLYRLALLKTAGVIYPLYSLLTGKPVYIAAAFVLLAVCGYIVGWFIKIEPAITGSGIPQVEGALDDKMSFNPFRVIVLKFIGGIISIGSGLSLGREGPSIQLGSAVGLGVGRVLKNDKAEEKLMLTYGSSAGLAAAFNAPVAGVLFALEELHKRFSAPLLIGTAAAAITADIVSKLFFGILPVFNIPVDGRIMFKDFWILIILGIVLGIFGVVFNKAILGAVSFYEKIFRLPVEYKPIISFLCAGIAGLTLPAVLGGGHELVQALADGKNNEYAIGFLLLLFVVKFLFTLVSYCSSSPGGIFLPLLSIGAILGCITAEIFVSFFGFDSSYINIFIVISMAGYFSSVVKSPITGIILIAEMTGNFESFLPVGIVCITAYIVSDVFKGEPVYEMLLRHSLEKSKKIS